MRITREKHWQFLEDELKAETEDFKLKFDASAKWLMDEKGEMFVAVFEGFHANGSMVMKFPNTRVIPRKGAHLMCMILPKELRSHTAWGAKTYRDLYARRLKSTDCVCIYHGRCDDSRFSIVGFRGVDVEFQKYLEDAKDVVLVFAPQFPPLEYMANLQNVVLNKQSQGIAQILDAEYRPCAWHPILVGDTACDKVLGQMSLSPTVILQGPPGTGKTYTIAQICAKLCSEGKSVLVTALTNQALVEIASKPALAEMLAQGKVSKMHLSVDEAKEVRGLRPANDAVPVAGSLLLATYYLASGAAALPGDDGAFDCVVMDEASQAFLAMFAAAQRLGKRNLWVGDIEQLAPVALLNPDRIKDSGYESLVDGLEFIARNRAFPVMQLTRTFRLGPRATKFTGIFYGDTLQSARNEMSYQLEGLENVVNPSGGPVVLFQEMAVGNVCPPDAIGLVISIVKKIREASQNKRIAILAHKIKTVVAIQRALSSTLGDIGDTIVETVAKVQGITRDITIFVVPNAGYHYGLERRLFNVATSRATEHTIIIADKTVLEHSELDRKVLSYLRMLGGEDVPAAIPVESILTGDEVLDAAIPPTLSEVQTLLDNVEVFLSHWLQSNLKAIYGDRTWSDGVVAKLTDLQRENMLDDGARTFYDLDFASLITVFTANFRDLRRKLHFKQELVNIARQMKDIRVTYAHKNVKTIVLPDAKAIQYHIDTIEQFLLGLGTNSATVASAVEKLKANLTK